MNTGKPLYPLSESQKSIWYLEKAYPGTSLNIVAGTLRFKGSVDFSALEKALNLYVRNNDAMRIRISEEDGTPQQYVTDFKSRTYDFFDFSKGEGLKDLFVWDEAQTRLPFNIVSQELFYCALFKVSDKEGGFYMKMHHLISDAWTMGLVVKHVVNYYTQIMNDHNEEWAPSPSFIEHIKSEAEYEASGRFIKDRAYWNAKFETLPEMTLLKPHKASENSITAKRKTMLTPLKLSHKIREFCKATHLSVFTLFMSALAIYINRVTGQDDIVLGTTILNRANAKEKDTAGMFVSVAAPLRISVNDTMNFKTFASAMLKENTDVLRHQRYPYNYLIRDLKKKHKFSNRLFDIVLTYQNSKFGKKEEEPDYTARWLFSGCQVESLMISINDREDEGNLVIDYDFLTDVFNLKEIEFIHQHIISLLWHALDNPLRSISKLEMISEREKRTILHDFNNTAADYPLGKTIHEMFEEQAGKTPGSAALLFKDQTMTYEELNVRANRLARVLRKNGIGPDKAVGIMSRRSFELVVGIMGILKAGGAYLPIDPDYPADRKLYMLDNSHADVLLTGHDVFGSVDFDGVTLDLEDERSYDADGTNLPLINSSGDLAYIIYTSGSTGMPKGVMIEHKGVINSCSWGQKKFSLDENSIILQKTAVTFDPSVWEIFWWLMIGGKVCLIESGDEKDPEAIISAIDAYKVTTMHFVPSMMSIFLNYVENTSAVQRLDSLKQVFSCGEALSMNQMEHFNRLLGAENGTKLFNMYGPTEATVEAACFDCSSGVTLDSVPIGERIDNLKIYILDRNLNLLPVGIPGEIYISGAGVARGYLNNAELTSERFIENPFLPGEIMYRTGDRARWYPKGDIEFLGRIDYQVKIKGFRIELGEIETRLNSHDLISEAAVKAETDGNGNTFLAAYVVADGISREEIRSYLAAALPDYMMPSCVMFLDKMPLNNNGKTDRNALPKPVFEVISAHGYEAPANETERTLSGIWGRVLGLSRVGVTEDYALLGGDSLNAIRIINEIHKQFGVELSPKYIFTLQTVRRLAQYISSVSKQVGGFRHIPRIEDSAYDQVSSAQKRQYILNKIDNGVSYNLPGGMLLEGDIDTAKVNEIFSRLIDRHESLRTSFEIRNGQPVQIVHPSVDFSIECRTAEEKDYGQLMDDFIRPFDLGTAPLFRAGLVTAAGNKHYLLFDMHHIISDGASINIIIKEFVSLYNGHEPELPAVRYRDYSAWHNQFLQSDKMKKQEAFWLGKFSDEIPLLNMPLDFVRPSVQSFRGNRLYFHMDRKLAAKIKKLAAESGATLFMLLMAAYNVLLSKYTGQEDIVVGTPVEGRNHSDLRGLVGMFVNTLAIRSKPASDKTFLEFLNDVKEDMLSVFENQEYPFEELVEKVGVKRDISRNPLFDTTFVLQNMDLSKVRAGELNITPFAYNNQTSKFDLALEALDLGDTIDYNIEYCTDLFREGTIRRISAHFINALEDIAGQPSKKLSDINLLSEEERHQLLYGFNDTEADYPRNKTIHQLFEEQVKKNPGHTALVLDGREMAYAELNAQANRLARTIRDSGVMRDDVVGIITNRSFEMVVAILGVLKAGGAYMPIDPEYPAERIAYMLQNSGAKTLLTKRALADTISFDGTMILLDDAASYAGEASDLSTVNRPQDIAYIIYTSGSTGKPKGVMIEHRNIVGLLFNNKFPFDFSENDTWTLFHNYCFDFTVWEMYGSLLRGGKLVIISSEVAQDTERYLDTLKKEKVTVLNQTPQAMYNLIRLETETDAKDLRIRYVFLGGESLKASQLLPLKEKYPSAEFINLYGPTESTIFVTLKRLGPQDFTGSVSNIGSSIAMAKTYVLDSRMNLVPLGVQGELYVSGNGIGRGYINNKTLTEERFIDNPFEAGGVLYKTGDLVRRLQSGDLEYLGRTDGQVKIRGFRIELGEIESQLLTVPGVLKAMVIDRTNANSGKKLYAYYISETELRTNELKASLSRHLPSYMLPSFFVRLDEFPLNTSGKTDKRLLPEPGDAMDGGTYEAPETFIEEKLAAIWSHVLGIGNIGVNDNFFELGGDSLNAITISSLIHKELEAEAPPKAVFSHQTVRELARFIETLPTYRYMSIPVVEAREFYPVSSAQKRQFILWQLEGRGVHYNIPTGFILKGETDPAKIEDVLKSIIDRHDSLRTSFELRDGAIVQVVHKSAAFSLARREGAEVDIEKVFAEFVRPFDLGCAPLFRAELIRTASDEHVLLIDMHHIISDGASASVFISEFAALYNGGELPPLNVQYKDYTAWHNALTASDKMKQQESYWLDRFSGELPALNLPLDFVRPSFQSFSGNRVCFSLDEMLTAGIKKLAAETGTTLFMFLLSAYTVLLSKYTGQEDIVVGTPIEGRRHAELRNIIGMFVNTLAVRSRPASEKTFETFLGEVKADLLNAYEHQDYPFEELVEQAALNRDVSRNPLFDTLFVLRNSELSGLQLEGLSVKPIEAYEKTAKFDLMLEAVDRGTTIGGRIEYCTDLFKESTIEGFCAHFINALRDIVSQPGKRLAEISILSAGERNRLLYEYNDTDAGYPRDKTIHRLFEEQAAKTPDNIALVYREKEMTYAELNAGANKLARTLRDCGVGPDDVVGVLADRSFEMIIAILAILKAGGAYMSIDPLYPSERIAYMLENSGAKVLLTLENEACRTDFKGRIVLLDDEEQRSADESNPDIINKPSDLAYIIYTSGSTGKPKGVMIEHRNVVRLLFNDKFQFAFGETDVWTLFHSFCFDFSVWEMYGALLYGGKLIVIPKEAAMDTRQFLRILKTEKVTVLNQTPSAFYSLASEDMSANAGLSALRYVIFGGEALKPHMLKTFKEKYPDIKLINMYGITETTVHVTFKEIMLSDTEKSVSNVGRPIPTLKVYITDRNMNLLPVGVPGEICVGGAGVGRGYLNNEQLTREKFVRLPEYGEGLLYRSGDLGRLLPDGDIEYLGRIDSQVKIRGFRIELGEIDRALIGYPEVNEGLTAVYETGSGEKKLCAYYKSDTELSASGLKAYLSGKLPGYMIPAYFIRVDAFPLNKNGKIDRAALPKPGEALDSIREIVKPRNVTEELLAQTWSEVLELQQVGIDDNFFELGGDSLSSLKVVTMLKLRINLIDFYTNPTIRLLSERIMSGESFENKSLLVKLTRGTGSSRCSVVCIPYGGGSAMAYRDLCDALIKKGADVSLYSVNLPGHEFGSGGEPEPIKTTAVRLAEEIESLPGDLILYGHCVGSGLLLETARLLENKGRPIKALFVGGIFPPRFIRLYGAFYKPWSIRSKAGIIGYLKKIGLPKDIFSDSAYIEYIIRVFRQDTAAYSRYMYSLNKERIGRIQAPMYFLAGEKDSTTKKYSKRYAEWGRYFESVKLFVLKGANHYFINTHPGEVVDYLLSMIENTKEE
jgi:tyrocidine synthetase-3